MKKLDAKGFSHLLLLLVIVVGVAVIGTYYLVKSNAQSKSDHVNQPSRGVFYDGLTEATSGPCSGEFVSTVKMSSKPTCIHPDPGPEGVDVRVRSKQVEGQLKAQADYDKIHKPVDPSNDPHPATPNITVTNPQDIESPGSLSNAPSVAFPCEGTGNDGYRITMVYVYSSSATNRVSTLHSYFASIATRIEGITYYSGTASGQKRLVRFRTTSGSSGCGLVIPAVSISSSYINSFDSIKSRLASVGYKDSNHHYLVEVDGGSNCGVGDEAIDSNPSPSQNYSNGPGGAEYAVVWHPCWNYGEPHELMHTMGAVQPGAPYSTKGGHCYDEHDVMCYNDGTGYTMQIICSNTANIWRYDCNHNTYFDAYGATGWLATHWNTANSYFYDK